jgi:hypothetical protein
MKVVYYFTETVIRNIFYSIMNMMVESYIVNIITSACYFCNNVFLATIEIE